MRHEQKAGGCDNRQAICRTDEHQLSDGSELARRRASAGREKKDFAHRGILGDSRYSLKDGSPEARAEAKQEKKCSKCEKIKPFEDFPPRASMKDGRDSHCRKCNNRLAAEWRGRNKGLKRHAPAISGEKRCTLCGEVKTLVEFPPKADCRDGRHSRCWACDHSRSRKYSAKLRAEVLNAYGGRCACCGESQEKFLAIDHVYNDGAAHRRQLGGRNASGSATYIWLRANGFPKDRFQLLCHNCNMAKSLYGICPHKEVKDLAA